MRSDRRIYMIGEDALGFVFSKMNQPFQGGRGGDGGDLSARLAKVESDVEHIKGGLIELKSAAMSGLKEASDLKVGQTELRVRVDHLPSKGFILTSLVTAVVVLVAIVTVLARMGWLMIAP